MAVLAQFQASIDELNKLVADIQSGTIVIGGTSAQDVSDTVAAVSAAVTNLASSLGQPSS